MERLFVYTKSPVLDVCGDALEIDLAIERGRFRYALCFEKGREESVKRVLDFIFRALVQNFVDDRLRIGGAESVVGDIFTQKLSAYLYITGNRNKIDTIVRSLIEENGVVNIDGVANFRLKELSGDISAFFDLLFYEYNVRKQYDDFISLVRDYIRLESPREETVHVVFGRGGFLLYNTEKANITRLAMEKYRMDCYASDGSLNDFLISSLLHFLPERIVIHAGESFWQKASADRRIIETIGTIFKESVSYCTIKECEFCGRSSILNYSLCDDINL